MPCHDVGTEPSGVPWAGRRDRPTPVEAILEPYHHGCSRTRGEMASPTPHLLLGDRGVGGEVASAEAAALSVPR